MDISEQTTCDANNLVKAYKKTIKASKDKHSVKKFMHHELEMIAKAQHELYNRTWKIENNSPFVINERGHIRKIQGNTPYDRMIIHSYIDFALQPLIEPYLLYDNYASQKDKGTSLARERFEEFLHKAYRYYGNNKFYVQVIDLRKFYDNIQHEKLKQQIFRYIPNEEFHHYMIDTILDSFKVDVSYMSDEEYKHCLDEVYIALDHIYYKGTGEKYMHKSMNIGNQASQLFSIFYPTVIDNYCKIVKGVKFYGRYMDDIFIISNNKEELHKLIDEIRNICKECGLFINQKKTQIYRVDKKFKYLNRIYSVTDTGHIKVKLSNETYIRERRKLKKFKEMLEDGTMTYKKIENQFLSWFGGNKKYISKNQRKQIIKLFNDLFDADIESKMKKHTINKEK